MIKKTFILLVLVVISASCSSNKSIPAPGVGSQAPSIAGKLSGSGGPLQNAEVKLKTYKDENCVKLAEKQNASKDEAEQLKQCSQEISSTTSDAQGKYAFPNVADGWYSVQVNWTTKEDPIKNNPMWKPFFLYRKEGFLITFIAAKDSTFRMLAVGEPFQVSGGNGAQKDLKLEL